MFQILRAAVTHARCVTTSVTLLLLGVGYVVQVHTTVLQAACGTWFGRVGSLASYALLLQLSCQKSHSALLRPLGCADVFESPGPKYVAA